MVGVGGRRAGVRSTECGCVATRATVEDTISKLIENTANRVLAYIILRSSALWGASAGRDKTAVDLWLIFQTIEKM